MNGPGWRTASEAHGSAQESMPASAPEVLNRCANRAVEFLCVLRVLCGFQSMYAVLISRIPIRARQRQPALSVILGQQALINVQAPRLEEIRRPRHIQPPRPIG